LNFTFNDAGFMRVLRQKWLKRRMDSAWFGCVFGENVTWRAALRVFAAFLDETARLVRGSANSPGVRPAPRPRQRLQALLFESLTRAKLLARAAPPNKKPRRKRGFLFGGASGTRTPDLRIMIPSL
jgi:hypothetical protein